MKLRTAWRRGGYVGLGAIAVMGLVMLASFNLDQKDVKTVIEAALRSAFAALGRVGEVSIIVGELISVALAVKALRRLVGPKLCIFMVLMAFLFGPVIHPLIGMGAQLALAHLIVFIFEEKVGPLIGRRHFANKEKSDDRSRPSPEEGRVSG